MSRFLRSSYQTNVRSVKAIFYICIFGLFPFSRTALLLNPLDSYNTENISITSVISLMCCIQPDI